MLGPHFREGVAGRLSAAGAQWCSHVPAAHSSHLGASKNPDARALPRVGVCEGRRRCIFLTFLQRCLRTATTANHFWWPLNGMVSEALPNLGAGLFSAVLFSPRHCFYHVVRSGGDAEPRPCEALCWGRARACPHCDSSRDQCHVRQSWAWGEQLPSQGGGSVCDSAKTRWKGQSSFWREVGVSGGLWRVVGLRQQQQKSLVHTGVDRLTCSRDGGNEHCKSESSLAGVQLTALLWFQ